MLRSDLCGFSDASVVFEGTITVADPNDVNYDKKLALKYNAPFPSSIWKINNTPIDHAEDVHVVIPLYNLLK